MKLLTLLPSELTLVEDSSPSPHETMAAQLSLVARAARERSRKTQGKEWE
jgi:hypothetical protein